MSKPKSKSPAYLTFAETVQRLGYKTRKSVSDLVRAGKLTPVRPKVVRGKHAPRVFFDASEVERLIPVSNPSRLSREQSAVRLGVHVRTIDRLVARGTLKAHAAPGGSRRRIEFELSDVDQLREEMNALRR